MIYGYARVSTNAQDLATQFDQLEAADRAKADGVKFEAKHKLSHYPQHEALKRHDIESATLRSVARSFNVSPQTISRISVEVRA